MATAQFSRRAKADLLSIGAYTLRNWGEAQAMRYLAGLESCCERLCERPLLGRGCEEIRPGLRRMEQGRHVIFYRQSDAEIVVSRILHRSMLPGIHTMDDELYS
jgi:toxin ParE1/3/4